jgi:hypothetical protein
MFRRRAIALALVLSSGCSGITLPYLKGQTPPRATSPLRHDERAEVYCQRIARSADRSAQVNLGLGIVTALAAAGSLAVGAIVGPDPASDANWAQRNRNMLILSAGGLLAIPATILLMRSRDASTASAVAGKAMFDDDAMLKCLAARSELAGARSAIADFVRKDLDGRRKALDEIQDEVGKDLEKERSKKSAAEQAKVKVLEDLYLRLGTMKLQDPGRAKPPETGP